ncbi:hypothetical protein [Haloglomus litoreum]|uniref:hypothetical protein n=1 Tax=Haloglomus litoreum TaxID=3034026 RepID=UPI0023E820CD|nr:hypothetical protein [Haloglomus sp. DT116]
MSSDGADPPSDLPPVDKVGDAEFGRSSPGRCAACLAWVRHPYRERTVDYCPTCYDLTEAERDRVRERVRRRLWGLWHSDGGSQEQVVDGGEG